MPERISFIPEGRIEDISSLIEGSPALAGDVVQHREVEG